MSTRFFLTQAVLAAFIVAAVFGAYAIVATPMEHGSCPFVAGQSVLCAAPLRHLTHWQSSFAAVLAELVVLIAFVAIFFTYKPFDPGALRFSAYRRFERTPRLPTVLQELFSQGILHSKEPRLVR